MHPSLVTLIERFRVAQDRAIAFIVDALGQTLGVRMPRNPMDWVNICGETGLYNVRWINGVEVYSHGYGIELIFGGLTIDFDWGEFGEPDGFDGWWLWNFARSNPCGVPCAERAQVRNWVEEAAAAGELTRDRYLYYSPTHRAGQRSAEPL
ncbi:MAG: hypothetical protein U0792_04860 [Gemmataceae bacterium]